ncbi:MAG: dimethylsulfoxide reductase subunit B [Coriobacteriales bacterium]|jgi:anaerobic dimethyl sulfoxide reductase subunit B (iron-sulfur subunit)|nr:dimethylsulfoxide reductase subunit B [Coriobacteriales bacterium]
MQYGFFFDNTRCTGCKTCELACKDYKNLGPENTFRRIYDFEGGSWHPTANGSWEQDAYAYHVSISCNHCNAPICVHVCPTGAMHKEDNGLVRVNSTVCIGCGYCTMACPYHAPHISEQSHTSAKCDGCYERTLAGKKPICVEACPLRALDFDDMTQLRMNYQGASSIAPLPDPSATLPNLIIKPSPAARETGDYSGIVANPLEII